MNVTYHYHVSPTLIDVLVVEVADDATVAEQALAIGKAFGDRKIRIFPTSFANCAKRVQEDILRYDSYEGRNITNT